MIQQITDIEQLMGTSIPELDEETLAKVKTLENWFDDNPINIIPFSDPANGEFGHLFFHNVIPKKGDTPLEINLISKLWDKTNETTHHSRLFFEEVFRRNVAKDFMVLRCHDPKRLRLGFVVVKGNGVEHHTIRLAAWKRGSNMKDWLNAVRKLSKEDVNEGNIEIHRLLNRLMKNSEWDKCDELIEEIDPKTDDIDLILSVLVSTSCAHKHLSKRANLYDDSFGRLKEVITTPGVMERLRGKRT